MNGELLSNLITWLVIRLHVFLKRLKQTSHWNNARSRIFRLCGDERAFVFGWKASHFTARFASGKFLFLRCVCSKPGCFSWCHSATRSSSPSYQLCGVAQICCKGETLVDIGAFSTRHVKREWTAGFSEEEPPISFSCRRFTDLADCVTTAAGHFFIVKMFINF